MNNAHNMPELDSQLSEALERKPFVYVSVDFAERVAARAATLPAPVPRRIHSYGRVATLTGAVLLLLAMFALAPSTQPDFSSVAFDLELVAAAQFVLIAWWVAVRRSA